MRIHALRLLTVVAAVLALALPAAGLAAPSAKNVDRGVIQTIDAGHIVLKALDGTATSFAIFPGTRVTLNGQRASVADLNAGLVAEVTADGKGRARVIRAFGATASVTERGVVTAVSVSSITIATEAGPKTVAIDRNTKFRLQGGPARRIVVRPGALVAVTHAADGPALVINVLKRAGA